MAPEIPTRATGQRRVTARKKRNAGTRGRYAGRGAVRLGDSWKARLWRRRGWSPASITMDGRTTPSCLTPVIFSSENRAVLRSANACRRCAPDSACQGSAWVRIGAPNAKSRWFRGPERSLPYPWARHLSPDARQKKAYGEVRCGAWKAPPDGCLHMRNSARISSVPCQCRFRR